jgi:uncharacterized membrane protein YedE/YeeE
MFLSIFANAGTIKLHQSYAFLSTNSALAIIVLLTVLEIVADFIPVLDHLVNATHMIIRPLVATMIMGALLYSLPIPAGLLVSLMVGGLISVAVHLVKSGVRAVVTTATFGLGNTLLSFGENIASAFLSLLAIVAPYIVIFITIAFLLTIGLIGRWLLRRLKRLQKRILYKQAGEIPFWSNSNYEVDFGKSTYKSYN